MSVLGTILGGGIDLLLGGINNMAAEQRAEKDRKENYMYGEMAAENADKRTRALYADFYSPQAMLNQYKEAGLSPAMMYGGTPGQGGMSGASAAGAASVQTPFMPISILEGAQAANLMAQTEKTKAETKTIEGKNKRGMAEIANIMADTGAKEASTCYTQALATGQEIANKLADNSYEFKLKEFEEQANYMYHAAKKAEYESNIAQNEAKISTETIQESIDIVKEQYKNLIADTAIKWSTKKLTDQEINESQQRMWKMIQEVQTGWVEALAHDKNATTYQEWVEAKIPYINKELELEAEKLGIENKRMWIDGVSKTVQGIGFTIMATSNAMNRGRQGETTSIPPLRTPNGQKVPTQYITIPKYQKYGKK